MMNAQDCYTRLTKASMHLQQSIKLKWTIRNDLIRNEEGRNRKVTKLVKIRT